VPSWLFALPLLVVVFMSRSRGPALALAAALLALLALHVAGRRRTPLVAVLSLLVVSVALLGPILDVSAIFASSADGSLLGRVALSDNPLATFLFRGQSADEIEGFSGRTELWRGLTVLFLDRPVLGYGYQGARALVLGVMPWAAYAHNAYIETLLDVGLLGSVPLILAALRGLAPGSLRGAVAGDVTASARAALFAVSVFLLVNSVTAESFAAAPGFETLALFVCAGTMGWLRAIARGEDAAVMGHAR
jgi:O-antigen ligase